MNNLLLSQFRKLMTLGLIILLSGTYLEGALVRGKVVSVYGGDTLPNLRVANEQVKEWLQVIDA